MTRKRTLLLVAAASLTLASGLIAGAYRRDIASARQRVGSLSRIAHTPCGPIEYADTGSGPIVLSLHGAGGGIDQGLLIGELIVGEGYRLIAPSRFGYLNTPIPAHPSIEAQADAYACLLDSLAIDEPVLVVGCSAGGPSALMFALRHPDRVNALVTVAAISYMEAPTDEDIRHENAINRLVSSDFVYWAALNVGRGPLLNLLGVSPGLQATLSPVSQQHADAFLQGMLPISERWPGIQVDQTYTMPRATTPLDAITAPALIMHARDDTLVPFSNATHLAQTIPDAQLLAVEQGGHFLLGNYDHLRERTRAFLTETQP